MQMKKGGVKKKRKTMHLCYPLRITPQSSTHSHVCTHASEDLYLSTSHTYSTYTHSDSLHTHTPSHTYAHTLHNRMHASASMSPYLSLICMHAVSAHLC
mmetsp:Transcript_48290/g.125309  ORF Transcript_48290/g.125309 Transcript_48290/m.125309 type:complete len:99 (-) Transcript_48290:40-336(-)